MEKGKAREWFATIKKRKEGPLYLTSLLFNSVFLKLSMFLPHTKKFFDLFEELADKAVEASQMLVDLCAADSSSSIPKSLSPDSRSSHLLRTRVQLRTLEGEERIPLFIKSYRNWFLTTHASPRRRVIYDISRITLTT